MTMTTLSAQQTHATTGHTDRFGSGPVAEEIRKLPFGEISWPMSGNEIIADVVS